MEETRGETRTSLRIGEGRTEEREQKSEKRRVDRNECRFRDTKRRGRKEREGGEEGAASPRGRVNYRDI